MQGMELGSTEEEEALELGEGKALSEQGFPTSLSSGPLVGLKLTTFSQYF